MAFGSSELRDFHSVNKEALYGAFAEARRMPSLTDTEEKQWQAGQVDLCSVACRWRIAHGADAWLASTPQWGWGESFLFATQKTTAHAFLHCVRLEAFFFFMGEVCRRGWRFYTWNVYFGAEVFSKAHQSCCFFVFGQAKLCIWVTSRSTNQNGVYKCIQRGL